MTMYFPELTRINGVIFHSHLFANETKARIRAEKLVDKLPSEAWGHIVQSGYRVVISDEASDLQNVGDIYRIDDEVAIQLDPMMCFLTKLDRPHLGDHAVISSVLVLLQLAEEYHLAHQDGKTEIEMTDAMLFAAQYEGALYLQERGFIDDATAYAQKRMKATRKGEAVRIKTQEVLTNAVGFIKRRVFKNA